MLSIIKKVHEQDQQKIEKHNNLQIKLLFQGHWDALHNLVLVDSDHQGAVKEGDDVAQD